MKKNIIFHSFKTTLFLCGLCCALDSCTDGFTELNNNSLFPGYEEQVERITGDTVSAEELVYLKKVINEAPVLFNTFSYEGVYADYQRTTNLYHDIYAGYFAHNKPDFNYTTPNYVYADGWMSRRWTHFYVERSKEYVDLTRAFHFVDREKYKNAYYITRIYYAFLGSLMTDTYGSIPFSSFVEGKLSAKNLTYDSQEKVYETIFKMLEEASDSIVPNKEGSFKFEGNNDNPYRGDESKWVRFANTLRLRLALRISNVDPIRARKEGEHAMSAPGGLMKSHADNMATTPLYALGSGGNENIHALCSFMWQDMVMAKDMELAYKNLSTGIDDVDPRCKVSWFKPSDYKDLLLGDEARRGDYTGSPVGNLKVTHQSDVYSILRSSQAKTSDTEWFGYKRESVWLSFAESRFLLSEASLRGWAGISSSSENYFLEGIRESMKYYKIDEASIDDYINGLKYKKANPFAANKREEALEQIITQKWLAVFPNGAEGWAEFRRTDYPRLLNNENNQSNDVRQGKFIKRILYPVSEHESNAANIPTEFLGAKDRQDVRLWWDVADTNDDNGVRVQPNNFR